MVLVGGGRGGGEQMRDSRGLPALALVLVLVLLCGADPSGVESSRVEVPCSAFCGCRTDRHLSPHAELLRAAQTRERSSEGQTGLPRFHLEAERRTFRSLPLHSF